MVKPNFKKLLTCILTILVLSLSFFNNSKAQSLYTPLYFADTLTEVNHTSFQWGDYSNSGYLGFIIAGYNDGNLTEVYKRDTFLVFYITKQILKIHCYLLQTELLPGAIIITTGY